MRMPLAASHLKMTCAGVPPMRAAAALSGASTGPPGVRVSGLGAGEHGARERSATHLSEPYAAVTMPCFALNSSSGFCAA